MSSIVSSMTGVRVTRDNEPFVVVNVYLLGNEPRYTVVSEDGRLIECIGDDIQVDGSTVAMNCMDFHESMELRLEGDDGLGGGQSDS